MSGRGVERLAVFGGVYSNHAAMRATLDDMAGVVLTGPEGASNASAFQWCLGDVNGFGPSPENAIEMLRESGVPTVQGTYDHSLGASLADCACGYVDAEDERLAQESYDYTTARVRDRSRAWLAALPREARVTLGGLRVLLCHGSPRRQNEFLWASACSQAFLAWLCDAYAADVIVCSHTGLHWHRALPGGRHVVNCGAIGRPAHDGKPGGSYALLSARERRLDVEFRFVRYDHEAFAREMEAERLPPPFVETIRTGWWTSCLGNVPARERLVAVT